LRRIPAPREAVHLSIYEHSDYNQGGWRYRFGELQTGYAGFKVGGIDQSCRQRFFGLEPSSLSNRWKPIEFVPGCPHHDFDIRNRVKNIFGQPV
jgi:hypothetical protein